MNDGERKTVLRDGTPGHAVHDVGGMDFGPVDRSEHDLALWEKRIDAMLILLVGPKRDAFKLDMHRRMIESYGQQTYDRTTYYEKWTRSIRNLLVEQGVLTKAEIEAAMADVARRHQDNGRVVAKAAIEWP